MTTRPSTFNKKFSAACSFLSDRIMPVIFVQFYLLRVFGHFQGGISHILTLIHCIFLQIQIHYSLRNTKCKQHEDHISTIHNTYTYTVVDSNDTCQ